MYIMYPILEDAFLRYPMRSKVADLLLRQGMRVDKAGFIYSGAVEVSPVKIARALKIDRRVVLETSQMIAEIPELFSIFESLAPTSYIRGVAKSLGFEVLELEAEPHAIGIVSAVTTIISDANISIRQIVSDDPDIYPNPKLTIIIEKRLPGPALLKLRELSQIKRLSIE
ncbi:regulator [Candidatus Micrarchaeota archaeon]|nr:regulator [Candidatus Micrarchaeota archaeon]